MSISEFYKFDLHIHSNISNLTKQNDYKGDFKEEDLLDKLIENGVDAFSITDHNIFNLGAYNKLFKIMPKNMTLFIGIEIDLLKEEDLINNLNECKHKKNTSKEKYHSLIIFKTKNIEKLNDKLLLMYKNLMEDYKKIYNETINLENEKNNAELFYRKTSLDRFFKYFVGEDYLIISHGNKSSGITDAYKGDIPTAQKMILLGLINSIEMSPSKVDAIIHYNEGFDKILSDEYKSRDDVPYVVFSDNHQIDAYPNYKSDQLIENRPFTWIKGDLSFETLRMAFVDPDSRIKLQISKPIKPAKYLEKLSFNLIENDGSQTEHIINFSSGINTIIGGRSSGKSLLVNTILHNINTSKIDSCKIDDYTKKDNTLIDIDSIKGKMNFESEFKSENICETVAYTQENIVNLFSNSGQNLSSHLEFEVYPPDTIQEKLSSTKLILDRLNEKYNNYYQNKSNRDLIILKEDLMNVSLSQDYSFHYEDGINEVKKIVISNSKNISDILNDLDETKEIIMKSKEIEIDRKPLFNEDDLEKINEVINIFDRKIKLLNTQLKKVKLKEKFIINLQNDLSAFVSKISSDKDSTISGARKRLNDGVLQAKSFFKSKMALKKQSEVMTNLNVQFEPLKKRVSDQYFLITDINCNFNYEVFLENMSKKINNFNKNSLFESLELMIYDKDKIKITRKTNSPNDFESLIRFIKSNIDELAMPKYSIIERGKSKNLSSDNMSPGKKASTFLEIKLEIGKYEQNSKIYIIDQPEDNIDNMFIADTLIYKIRELRDTCQIILVTHNAAIAINSDSENIIIADNKDGKITYSSGCIENIDFRKDACKLLDGGYYVFDRRYHKYDIPLRKIYEPINKEIPNE